MHSIMEVDDGKNVSVIFNTFAAKSYQTEINSGLKGPATFRTGPKFS